MNASERRQAAAAVKPIRTWTEPPPDDLTPFTPTCLYCGGVMAGRCECPTCRAVMGERESGVRYIRVPPASRQSLAWSRVWSLMTPDQRARSLAMQNDIDRQTAELYESDDWRKSHDKP